MRRRQGFAAGVGTGVTAAALMAYSGPALATQRHLAGVALASAGPLAWLWQTQQYRACDCYSAGWVAGLWLAQVPMLMVWFGTLSAGWTWHFEILQDRHTPASCDPRELLTRLMGFSVRLPFAPEGPHWDAEAQRCDCTVSLPPGDACAVPEAVEAPSELEFTAVTALIDIGRTSRASQCDYLERLYGHMTRDMNLVVYTEAWAARGCCDCLKSTMPPCAR